jgi:hypothetical protein
VSHTFGAAGQRQDVRTDHHTTARWPSRQHQHLRHATTSSGGQQILAELSSGALMKGW